MNHNQPIINNFLEALDKVELISKYENYNKSGKNCEWCRRIKYTKTCECVLNTMARQVARGLKT